MRITIDATALLLRSAGVKGYVWNWLQSLERCGCAHEFYAFPAIGTRPALRHDQSIYPKLQTYPPITLLHAANHVPGVLDAMLRKSDVFHASNQVRRRPARVRLTSTIHDLTAFTLKSLHTDGNRRADQEWANEILKGAAGVIAVSENTKRDAVERLGLHPDRITRIYSGVAPEYFAVEPSSVESARQKFKLTRPYVLFVGSIEPRKNIDRLLDAWGRLPADLRVEHDLVIAGPYGWGAEQTFLRLVEAAPGIRYLGYVGEAFLPGLTSGATVLVYPSLYEGFGFPVAQAMAAGVAVLTSYTSCLPEVAGKGAVYVDPFSVADITYTLARLLTSPTERHKLGSTGKQRAQAYTWDNCARQSIQFFESVCGL